MLQLMQLLANTQQMQVAASQVSAASAPQVDRDSTNVVKFSGEGGVMPQTFIRDCNLVFTTKAEAKLPQSDKQKILYAVNHTLSTAHDWAATWYHSTTGAAATWAAFCEAFLQQYVPIDDELNALNKLRSLKIRGDFMSLAEAGLKQYTSEFNETVLRLPNEPELVLAQALPLQPVPAATEGSQQEHPAVARDRRLRLEWQEQSACSRRWCSCECGHTRVANHVQPNWEDEQVRRPRRRPAKPTVQAATPASQTRLRTATLSKEGVVSVKRWTVQLPRWRTVGTWAASRDVDTARA